RHMIAKDIDRFLDVAELDINDADSARFVLLPASGIGDDYPESGEKLSLSLAVYRAGDFAEAIDITNDILSHQGAGHSVGIHTSDDYRAVHLGQTLPTCRVIVNQAHCFATGGSFDNGLPFSLSMGCGSWGGNSIDGNLNYHHFLNTTRIVRPIATDEPELDDIFSSYWQDAGR
nr:sulfoacetaldehyde dehydrogenase [Granulosicoccus sp.]